MGLQKFRADDAGERQTNGATPHYTRWIGGPTLALIRDCPCKNDPLVTPRTVYLTGHADTFFSIPAACKWRGKVIRGYVTSDDDRNYVFVRYLPWLTFRALEKMRDELGHHTRVIALFKADKAPSEMVVIYERKRDRLAAVVAKLEVRATKRR